MPQDADKITDRLCIVDPRRQLLRREAAEDHRVHRAEPRAGEHARRPLREPRHVDDDAVALADAMRAQRAGQLCDLIAQLEVRVAAHGARDGAVVDERALFAAAALDVAVDGVVARVEHAAGEPADERRAPIVEHAVPSLDPRNRLGGGAPEPFRIAKRALVCLVVTRRRSP